MGSRGTSQGRGPAVLKKNSPVSVFEKAKKRYGVETNNENAVKALDELFRMPAEEYTKIRKIWNRDMNEHIKVDGSTMYVNSKTTVGEIKRALRNFKK